MTKIERIHKDESEYLYYTTMNHVEIEIRIKPANNRRQADKYLKNFLKSIKDSINNNFL